jgi:hypothetical protein
MAWRIAGTYVAHCNCHQVCGCAWDQPPSAPEGTCRGIAVFHVEEGDLDGTDLSGVNFALFFRIPEHFSAGFDMGVVVDDGASDEQADALGRIIEGTEGGPMEDFAGIRSEWLGVERSRVSFSDGDEPSASVGDTEIRFDAFRGQDGQPSTAVNAPFGLAPVFRLGSSSGHSSLFGQEFDAVYGEAAEYEYSTEQGG